MLSIEIAAPLGADLRRVFAVDMLDLADRMGCQVTLRANETTFMVNPGDSPVALIDAFDTFYTLCEYLSAGTDRPNGKNARKQRWIWWKDYITNQMHRVEVTGWRHGSPLFMLDGITRSANKGQWLTAQPLSPSEDADAAAPSAAAGEWDQRYRPLEAGEAILPTDQIQRDDGMWAAVSPDRDRVAPDPAYTSHRKYRRLRDDVRQEKPA
jgi:hypothetical protein